MLGMLPALFVLVLLSTFPVQGQETFSIEEVMSAPFPEGLVSAPEVGVVAWVYNDEGVRNLWVRVGDEGGPRQITSYDDDDGQGLGSLLITPDGSHILFLRGGGPNRQGEFPNPLSWKDGAGSSLWILPVRGGEPRRIKSGGGVILSPDGSRMAFSSGNTISTMSLEEGAEAEEMATVRGNPSSLTWSPDGERLAFVSNRGDHAFIGIIEAETEKVRYLDPSLTLDQNPVWSPDGRFIAHTRTQAEEGDLPFAPIREALPWSIRVVEADTGEGRTVWTAREGPGSAFHGVSSARQLHWGAGDLIVFPWEGDGWLGLYSVPASGGDATDLTPGLFEVQFVAMAQGGEDVLFSSNQDDIDRQHVWRASVDGASLELLTPGEGIEWSPVLADEEGGIAFLASGSTTPARAELRNASGERERLLPPNAWDRFPANALVEPEQVVFSAADGMSIHGQLFLPADHRDGQKHPALLFFHGGSRRQMLLGFHHRGYYHNAYAFNQYLASQGYVVLSVNYRSGIGYGMEFREALEYGATGASEFNDVLGAGLYLQSRSDVDPDRIGLWGGSYGGYLTALGLARASDLFAAGVDLHGVHDWNVVINGFVPSYKTIEHPEFAALAFRSSPMADIEGWRSPVLLIHGDDDRNVPFSESVDLAVALTRQGVEYEELVFPDEVHGFLLHSNWIAAFRASADFFERKLHPGR
jgi:dipeptidyl aminopeptidase/acylaminoacyl peptidase